MNLDNNYWENYLNELMIKIMGVANNKEIGEHLQNELISLYRKLNNKNETLEKRKQIGVLVEHYLEIAKKITENSVKKR